MKEELRSIPRKNYFILGIVIIVTIFLLYYFYMWFNAYNESKLNMPILDKYMEVINYNELDDYIIENPDSVIYVSVLENEKIREFEKKFRNRIKNNRIDVEVLYLDLTNDVKNSNVMNELNSKYSINSLSIMDVPCIMVIENGSLKTIYSIKDNEYDVSKVELFLNEIKFYNGDGIND